MSDEQDGTNRDDQWSRETERGDAGGERSAVRRPSTRELPDFRPFLRNAPHPLAVVAGAENRLVEANDAFRLLLDPPGEEILGLSIERVVPPWCSRRAAEVIEQVRSTGVAEAESEISRREPGARSLSWSFIVWPFEGAADHPADAYFVEIRDCTREADAYLQLEALAEQIRETNQRLLTSALQEFEWAEKAEEANRTKSDFLAMMSHELRTPLTGIFGYADVLDTEIAGALTSRQKTCVERIRECSAQLQELIDDILSFAQIESGTVTVNPQPVDLCQLARQATEVVQPSASRKAIGLVLSTPETPIIVSTDARKVRQILLNLLSNAVKFTESGEVKLELIERPEEIRFVVTDTGPGIAAEDLTRVFQPFVQAEKVRTRRHGGTGLGLAISRSLAGMLGGDVRAESRVGSGSRFSVLLPAGREDGTRAVN